MVMIKKEISTFLVYSKMGKKAMLRFIPVGSCHFHDLFFPPAQTYRLGLSSSHCILLFAVRFSKLGSAQVRGAYANHVGEFFISSGECDDEKAHMPSWEQGKTLHGCFDLE